MFAVVLYLLPLVLARSPYVLFALTLTLCYAIPAMALNLLLGYTGLVSLGHMGFAGIGAYVTALLMKNGIASFAPAIVAGTIVTGLVGALVGIPCLRLRSHFFIIVTLAVGIDTLSAVQQSGLADRRRRRASGRAASGPDQSWLRDHRSTSAGWVLFPCRDDFSSGFHYPIRPRSIPISAGRLRPFVRTRRWRRAAASTCSATN